MTRQDGRLNDVVRPTRLTPGVAVHAEGSVMIEVGLTKVLCTASVEDKVPPFMRGTGKGWVTAEYGMLPRATSTRTTRESTAGKVGGRTQEIQRLIGRSLRSIVTMTELGERTVWIDCDVLQADGGTRTASITGSLVALVDAIQSIGDPAFAERYPLRSSVAAISVGVVGGQPVLDLPYDEDVTATVDMNVVMTGRGEYVEIQGTGEEATFTDQQLGQLLCLAHGGIRQLTDHQRNALGNDWPAAFAVSRPADTVDQINTGFPNLRRTTAN